MVCNCHQGWGGEFCFQEYCPNDCEIKMNYGKCVATKDVREAAAATAATAAATAGTTAGTTAEEVADGTLHPVCYAAKERTNLRTKHSPAQWCHDLTSIEACTTSYVSKSKPSDVTHELALCIFDPIKKMCGHSDWTLCAAEKNGLITGGNGNPYFCQCQAGFSGPDCSGTSGCGATGHSCGANGQCVQGACLCHSGYAGPTCQVI